LADDPFSDADLLDHIALRFAHSVLLAERITVEFDDLRRLQDGLPLERSMVGANQRLGLSSAYEFKRLVIEARQGSPRQLTADSLVDLNRNIREPGTEEIVREGQEQIIEERVTHVGYLHDRPFDAAAIILAKLPLDNAFADFTIATALLAANLVLLRANLYPLVLSAHHANNLREVHLDYSSEMQGSVLVDYLLAAYQDGVDYHLSAANPQGPNSDWRLPVAARSRPPRLRAVAPRARSSAARPVPNAALPPAPVGFPLGHFFSRETKKLIRVGGYKVAFHHLALCALVSKEGDGALTGKTDVEIEIEVDWDGEPGALIAALVQCGFISGESTSRVLKPL